jgi:parallel beta-helix repeat protein
VTCNTSWFRGAPAPGTSVYLCCIAKTWCKGGKRMTTRTERSSPRWAALGLLLGLGIGTGSAEAQNLIDECPFTITEPGSYQLAGDLECEGEGIIILADNVRLNLGGGTLTGPDDGDSDGVIAPGSEDDPITGLRINGGTITGFNAAIVLDFAPGARIAGVTASANDGGINVEDSPRTLIVGNTAANNDQDGIIVLRCDRSTFTLNRVLDNGDEGIVLTETTGARVAGNATSGNGEDGIDLDVETHDNLVVANRTTGNGQSGIEVGITEVIDASTGNRLTLNRSVDNGLESGFDMEDLSLPDACVNTWRANSFETDNEGDGPGSGCIR